MAIKNSTSSTFANDVLNSELPTLVDFWAAWCAPCRMVAPILEDIAEQNKKTLNVVKVNIDENPEIANQYGIRSIPTFKVFVNGSIDMEFSGAMPKAQFENALSNYIHK
ncbi:thioredoxin [Citrobacter telavivensis]